ncbi:methyl-accepting chemotaxis protein [Desulfovibrio sp. PG-178-WT-4]|uniref:Methyl-accepting chemotaxis protein n=2 Tax=Desulfovibrio TaxID=872 RepID=A0A6L5XMU9_9BACT|nr:methyl-accepting chemotaxis protein [Desulfovibrio porci]MSS28435.1 methyl-accepting chemotaxis protein [Desulfovibrio porci]
MKLSTKICVSMGLLTLLMAILTTYLLMQMATVNEASTEIADQKMPIVDLAGRLNAEVTQYRVIEMRHIYATDPAAMAKDDQELDQQRAKISDIMNTLDKRIYMPNVREIFNRLSKARDAYHSISENILTLSRNMETEKAVAIILGDSRTAYQNLSAVLRELSDIAMKNAVAVSREGDAMYDRSRMIGIGMTLAAIFIAVLLTVLTVRNTIRQLGKDPGELNAIARRVVDGDYNIDDGGKKLGVYGAIVDMVAALKNHIENAQRESENAREQSARAQEAMQQAEAASREAQSKAEAMLAAADKLEQVGSVVSSASTQLSAQIEQSDRGAAESASRLSEAATAMNEMNATVQEVARNAGSASAASAETREKAEAGARVVEKTVHNIEEVHQLSLTLKDDMTQLNEHAQDITRIMGVISDIADQTNLLALNAAIEAARAGEAGRGFAVVADEVRKLAEKTMSSTNDVGNAIKAIQESTAKSMSGVDNAVERIGEATELANQSGQALQEIVATVEATGDQVNAIATASEEQSAASEEINQSIVQVNDMSRQTAEAMGEAAKAVSDLAAQAQGLTNLIQELKQA